VAGVPVSSASGWKLVRNEADEVVCPIVSSVYPFAVASFYEQWSDLTDEEVIESLDTLKKRPETIIIKEARLWQKLDDQRVHCYLCAHECRK